ncbi:GPO family capsid scaffolding protein [Serratia marcescens]
MKKNRFLVAISGTTTDGRQLPVDDIFQLAKHYDPKLCAALVQEEFGSSPAFFGGEVQRLEAEMVADKAHLYAAVNVSTEFLGRAKEWVVPRVFAIAIDYNSMGGLLPSPYLHALAATTHPAIKGLDVITWDALAQCVYPEPNIH